MNQRRAQTAIAIVFAVHGTVSGSFATRVPWIRQHLDLGAGELGLALLAPALGAVLAPPVAAAVSARFGARATTATGLLALCTLLAVPAFTVNLSSLWGVLLVFGVAAGTADISMKNQATAFERETGKPVVSRLHGLWSVGTLVGAGLGTAASAFDLDARPHLVAVAIGLVVLSATAAVRLPHLGVAARPTRPARPRPARPTVPSRNLLAIGLIGFCAAFAEAAAHSWSSVFIAQLPGGGGAAASVGFGVFVASMATARFTGDGLVRRFGPATVVRTGAALAAAGLIVVISADAVGGVVVGFGLVGLGLAAVVPVVVSAAGRTGSDPHHAIFTVVTMMYAAGLASPGTVGGIAGSASLTTAFAVTALVTVVIVLLAGSLAPRRTAVSRMSLTRPARIGARLVVSMTRPARPRVRRAVTLTRAARPEPVVAHSFAASTASHDMAVSLAGSPGSGTVSVSFREPERHTAPTSTHTLPVRMTQDETVEIPKVLVGAAPTR